MAAADTFALHQEEQDGEEHNAFKAGFVELARVARHLCRVGREYHGPGHVGRSAIELAIHEVAKPAELDRIDAGTTPETPLFQALAPIMAVHRLPIELFRDLLSAFAQDVTVKRYADYESLLDYCRRSADPVGRLLLHLFEVATPDNLRRSDAICTALQLINFWQDIAIDWEKGRVYLPQEDLARFGVAEARIAEAPADAAWQALLAFQVQRTTALIDSPGFQEFTFPNTMLKS